jgi:hypothetical protein
MLLVSQLRFRVLAVFAALALVMPMVMMPAGAVQAQEKCPWERIMYLDAEIKVIGDQLVLVYETEAGYEEIPFSLSELRCACTLTEERADEQKVPLQTQGNSILVPEEPEYEYDYCDEAQLSTPEITLSTAAGAISSRGVELEIFELAPETRKGSVLVHEFESSGTKLRYHKDGFSIEVPVTLDKGIEVDFGEVQVNVKMWAGEMLTRSIGSDQEVQFKGNKKRIVSVLPKDDGSVQLLVTMLDESAPVRHKFTLNSSGYDHLKVQEDGSVVALDDNGDFVFGIAAPWAKDANGQVIPTHFEANGQTLVQVVQLHEAESPVEFPIVADPWMGIDLYSSVYVTFVPSGYVVNATPSTWGKTWVGPATWGAHVSEVKSKAGRWNASIENQLLCHLLGFPLSLPTYNLESWRPNVHYATSLVKYRCNPGPDAGGS